MSDIELAIEGVSKRFGGTVANDDVSFDLRRGEILGLIGPNGAGKTTTLNIASGMLAPDAGSIRLRGEEVAGHSAHRLCRRGLMRTFQTPRTFANISVEENLLVQPNSHGRLFVSSSDRRRDAARATELIETMGLGPLRSARAKELSGGQQALLQVACGFMNARLSCYLLDEAFSGINPVLAEKIIEMILIERERRGVSFLVVSHEMPVIRRLCDRVVVMANASVLATGSLEEISANETVVSAYLGDGALH